ncbi:glycosyltransferase [Schleiferilactobacillus perolens]|uniref:Glycosyltransferase n=1 Tax=Schleiferilactobacillus perolens DSM 12744 TaxID=1423792 RepID=A0A0R1N438_9LACO|nr:glycosyltransferase [Schleiferilactobacillus perolens]KRL12533.1 glycosyltransferase [Schleiferilactobacillus perolens DSM 12744]
MVQISVIMAAYNETAAQVDAAIQSILGQTFTDLELIIVSDNPQNERLNTQLTNWQKKDARIRLLPNQRNAGLAFSLNRAIRHAQAPWLARMDADDISRPNRLAEQMRIINARRLDVLSTNADFIDETGQVVGQHDWIPEKAEDLAQLLPFGSNLIHPSVLMRTATIRSVGSYRLLPTAEDYDLWLRLLKADFRIGATNQRLFQYRLRHNSMTQGDRYLVFLVTDYLQHAFREDEYPEEELELQRLNDLLTSKRANDPIVKQQFSAAVLNLSQGKQALKQKNIFRAMKLVLPALKQRDVRQYALTSRRFSKAYQQIQQREQQDGE